MANTPSSNSGPSRPFYSTLVAVLLLCAACGGPSEEAASNNTPATATPTTVQSAAPTEQNYAAVNAARLLAANEEPGQWMSHGRTYDEQRFSPLKQVNTDNIQELGLAFYSDLGTHLTQEATPLMIDGVIYVATARSHVEAYDARTGERLWS